MRRMLLIILLVLAPIQAFAQATHISTSGTLPASCRVGDVYYKTGTLELYDCPVANTWRLVSSVGNRFFAVTGPATSVKTFTFPNASATVLTDNALVTAAQGGTNNGFFAVTGPATSTKTFTFPNASATVLTDNAAVTRAQGGTGQTTSTDDNVLVGNGTLWELKALTNCTSSNEAMTYTASSNTWGCHTISAGAISGAPDDALYWTGAANSGLSAEKDLSGFTGIVKNTAGTPSAATAGIDYAAITWQPPVGLRLSASTNTYVPTTDVTGATTIYWTTVASGGSGVVTCYNGSALARSAITQKSLALGTLTSGKLYNVYWDCDGAAMALGAAWTNDTTPSETLADESGALVLSSDHTQLYIGLIRTTSTTTTEDSCGGSTTQVGGKRFVWNAYNRVDRCLAVFDSSDYGYATATWRQAAGAAGNKVEFVVGLVGDSADVLIQAVAQCNNNSDTSHVGVGVDSTTAPSGLYGAGCFLNNTVAAIWVGTTGNYKGPVSIGYHYFAWLEKGGGGNLTWTGSGARHHGLDATIKN